jgi:60 kDa SS-A/Ro ribonucleoprotein
MGKFNTPTVDLTETKNFEGGKAFTLSKEMELYSLVCTALIADKFYETADEQLVRLVNLVNSCDEKFVYSLARYAREEMNLRSVPIVLAVLLCYKKGSTLGRLTVSSVIKRADEITEALAYYGTINRDPACSTKKLGKIPNSLKKGIKDVFESGRFNEYQYAKYNTAGKGVSFKDAIFVSHPKHDKDGLHKKIIDGTLETPYTWETAISSAGQTGEADAKARAWKGLLESGKLPYMAALRNINNILKENAKYPEIVGESAIEDLCFLLVKGSKTGKQFPFRYWSAVKAIQYDNVPRYDLFEKISLKSIPSNESDSFMVKKVVDALDEAMKNCVKSFPVFEGNVYIATDFSGSMTSLLNNRSTITYREIGSVMSAVLSANPELNTLTGIFGSIFKPLTLRGDSPLGAVQHMEDNSNAVGYATDGHLVLDHLTKKKTKVDHLLFFSDCQFWNSSGWGRGNSTFDDSLKQYRSKVNKDVVVWLFDLAGHGTSPVNISKDRKTIQIAGWSDRVFEATNAVLNGTSIVEHIKNLY